MNLTNNTKIIDAAIEQKRYPSSEELKKIKIWLKERQSEAEITKIVSEAREDLLNKIKIKLSSKIDPRVNSLNLKNTTLEQRLSISFSRYINTCIDYIDTCLRLTSYSLISGEIEHLLKTIDSKDIHCFLDTMGISLNIIFEDFNEIKTIINSEISSNFKNKFLEYFQPISEVILQNIATNKIYKQALELFEDEEETQHWFSTPKTRLGGKTPLEAMETKAGAEKVEEILYQAEFGMVS
jgi:uncharacterized protein with gpF-like domain